MNNGKRIHLVYSPLGGSGKTTLSSHLIEFLDGKSIGYDFTVTNNCLSSVLGLSSFLGEGVSEGMFFKKFISFSESQKGAENIIVDFGCDSGELWLRALSSIKDEHFNEWRKDLGCSEVFVHIVIPSSLLSCGVLSLQTILNKNIIDKIGEKKVIFWINHFLSFSPPNKDISEIIYSEFNYCFDANPYLFHFGEYDHFTKDSLDRFVKYKSFEYFYEEATDKRVGNSLLGYYFDEFDYERIGYASSYVSSYISAVKIDNSRSPSFLPDKVGYDMKRETEIEEIEEIEEIDVEDD